MPLPADYYTGQISDIRQRFGNTFIEYKGLPVYVFNIYKDGSLFYLKLLNIPDEVGKPFSKQTVCVDDANLNMRGFGVNLGYYNIPNKDGCFFVSKFPRRSMTHGIAYNTCVGGYYKNDKQYFIYDMGHSGPPGFGIDYRSALDLSNEEQLNITNLCSIYSMPSHIYALIFNKGFRDAYQNKYPKIEEKLDTLIDSECVAVSRKHIIERDKFGHVYLVHKGSRVGEFSLGKVRFLPHKEYLSGEIERVLGIQPV